MTRNENDLRTALQDLDRRALDQDAPSAADIFAHTTTIGASTGSASSRFPRWAAPLAAAALIATGAVTTVALTTGNGGSPDPNASAAAQATGARLSARDNVSTPHTSRTASTSSAPTSPAGRVLEDAATKLDAATDLATPPAQDYFYVRTNQATSWTSVTGRKPGEERTVRGDKISIDGCKNGHIVADGDSGTCTLNDVPHYRADAPTTPAAWDAYLEQIAPGAKAAHAQGKIIVQVLHGDLISPQATAALLRYTESCPGLHTLAVRPVAGEKLTGVTCTSMTNGSYGLVFDTSTHDYAGFVPVTEAGRQTSTAEIIRVTAIVTTIGKQP